jgi:hypothetical protein
VAFFFAPFCMLEDFIKAGDHGGVGRDCLKLVGEDVARATIDLLLDLLESLWSDRGEVMPFGEMLSDRIVMNFYPAFFP